MDEVKRLIIAGIVICVLSPFLLMVIVKLVMKMFGKGNKG